MSELDDELLTFPVLYTVAKHQIKFICLEYINDLLLRCRNNLRINAVKKTTKIRRSKAPRDINTVMEDKPPNLIASEIYFRVDNSQSPVLEQIIGNIKSQSESKLSLPETCN